MEKRGFLLVLTAFILLLISCTAAGKKESDESLPAGKTKNKKPTKTTVVKKRSTEKPSKKITLPNRASEISNFADKKGYSTQYCFLIDMSLPSGRDRFFVYDLQKKSVAYSGLVAHGSCNENFIAHARFSNSSNSGCSSLGKFKVGDFYRGKYGKSYRLYGLDNSNSNAYSRAVVIHGYDCVPDEEIYPRVLCNSLGCPMVSYNFFDRLSRIIERSEKPILLWIYR